MNNNYTSFCGSKSANRSLVLALLLFFPFLLPAQAVLQRESFESTIFPAPGWRQVKLSSNLVAAFSRQAVATATNPVVPAPAGGGSNVMMLNSFVAGSSAFPDTAVMVTKPFDFSNNAGVNPDFKISVYRENGFSTQDDHVAVYINTSPSLSGATLLTHNAGANKIPRFSGAFPAVTSGTWNQYTYSLPAATYNGKRYYFIIAGVAKAGNNTYIDLCDVNTYPSATAIADVSFNFFLQNGASGSLGATNHMIVGVQCIVGGTSGCGVAGVNAVKLDSLLFNTNGTTNINDIQNAKVWYTGGSNLFSTGYISPFPATAGADDYPSAQFGQTIGVPQTNLDFVNGSTSCFNLEYDTTYFWLTYDIKPTATGGNNLDADFRGSAVGASGGSCPSIPGTSTTPPTTVFTGLGASQIDLPYCLPTYTVGTAWAGYTNNDYVQSVVLAGSNGTLINTNVQGGMPYPSNNNAGLPTGLGCYGSCDFTAHPPDYELWQTVAARTVTLIQNQSYTITVQAGTWFSSNYITAWIDYNRDGDFLDAGEQLFTPSNLAANASSNHVFTVPAAGYTGPTRLRVREVFANSTINPCQQYTYGETEDFNIFISPNCPIGYKLWLGNTNNWHDPANWCGGVPTILDSAVVNRALVPGGVSNRRYFPPTILNNANPANCNSLFISAQDTLMVNAPIPATPAALKVRTNLINNGRIEVISGLSTASSITFGTGTLSLANQTPFRTTTSDTRTQIIYSAAELAGAGLVANDKLSAILFSLWNKGSSTPFNGFTVSYALVPFDVHATNVPYAGPFTTVFGPTAFSTLLGANTITLNTPIVWDGTSNLLIQYCFDNPGSAGGTTDDRIYNTQTTGFKRTLITFTTTNAGSGCSLIPGAGVIDFFAAAQYRPNFTFLVDRTYGKPVLNIQKDWTNNGNFVAGNSRVVMDSTVAQVLGGSSATNFHEYQVNKGAATQAVTMQSNISVSDTLLLSQGCLLLNGKTLNILNSAASTGTNTNFASIGGPITRTNGFIISETPAALPTVSGVRWTVGTTPGWRVIPFGSSAASPTAIPFTFEHKSGDLGVFSVSTYSTPAANTPLPSTVTHLRNYNNTVLPDNSANVVNRFWLTDKTGANPTTNIVFRWPDAENSVGMSSLNPPRAQPWHLVNSPLYEAWLRISNYSGMPGLPSVLSTPTAYLQSFQVITGVDSCRVIDWNWPTAVPTGQPVGNYLPWALSNNNQPLPVELLDFRADIINKKVRLSWITASETNNDYFTVERNDATLDDDDFSFIAKVNSYMNNSNMMLSYEAWDHSPLPGLQYYRLKQTDLDGQYTYSDLEPVMFGNGASFDITNVYGYTETEGQFSVEFNYDSELPVNAVITDASGRVVFKQDNIPAVQGANRLQVGQSLPRGIYFILLQNQEKSVNRKFFY